MEQIFRYIDQNQDRFKKLWVDISRMETPTADKEALDAMAAYLAGFCRAEGFQVTEHAFPEAGTCLAVELRGDATEPWVAVMAHMDTVHQKGNFGAPVVRERNGILYGPGVYDCKGGIAMALLAMASIKNAAERPRSIRLILTSDEEENGRYSKEKGLQFIRSSLEGCTAAFSCESGVRGFATLGRKGVARIEVTVRGKSAHAGNSYFEGASAIRAAAHKIIEIEGRSVEGRTTFNCGIINGGTVPNIVPDRCGFTVDVRFCSNDELDLAVDIVKEIASRPHVKGTGGEAILIGMRPAMEHTADNDKLLAKLNHVAKGSNLEVLTQMERGGGSDAAYPVQMGIPTLCSMGVIGKNEHTDMEQAEISSLGSRARLLAAAITEIAL